VSTDTTEYQQLMDSFADATYRHEFNDAHVADTLAFQIRAMREARGWSQQELAQRAGMKQARISQLEDPDYVRPSLSTLLRLKRAFDVALDVKFVPFSELATWSANFSTEDLAVPAFDHDPEREPAHANAGNVTSPCPEISVFLSSNNKARPENQRPASNGNDR
jgi:transcriptional regulator with XRE-family HTH domain